MKLYETLIAQLKCENDFVSDNGELKKWVVADKARNYDAELLALLLENEDLKKTFFKDINGTMVFLLEKFLLFIEQKNYLNDSYTAYSNKIGLTIGGRFLNQRNEVELVWPYKDCILEGGQTKEDQKRPEIFFNQTLAHDEITQLLDPKVLTGYKRYSSNGVETCHGASLPFTRDAELNEKRGLPKDTITDNLVIKGNNLLALHSLKKEFAGKVKLIYIDPPYNTGNDSFGYNDSFNHSTWLTFMKNRLEVAKTLLKKDSGCIWISCDDREQAYLKILCDEIFGRENFLNDVIWNSTKSVTNTALISVSHTHNLIYFKNKKYYIENRTDFRIKENGEGFSNPDNDKRGPWKADPFQVGGWRPNQQYEIINPKTGAKYLPNDGCSWKNDYEKYMALVADNRIVFGVDGEAGPQRKRFLTEALERGKVAKTIWDDIDTTTNATQHNKKMFGKNVFSNPKPEGLIERIIELSTKESDIVLDYHLGSGTTAAVAHKMNRQYIGIEQMDYIESVTIERMKKVMAGEQDGISKSVGWNPKNPSLEDSANGRYERNNFVYLELKKYNQTFIERIEESQDTKTLLQIWEQMKEKSFLAYNIDIKTQEANMAVFVQLDLTQQKQVLCELLDKNQLYVNVSDMNDERFETTEEERKVTEAFYSKK